ncbi:guanylate kinase [Clostridia bacterium]|nr:guanylate kinase [Clostridia bacterium]
MMNNGKLIIISGPAGSGKGTVVNELMSRSNTYKLSVSATSRAPRPADKEGVTYYFKSRGQFEEMIANNGLLEYTQYNSNYYGTPRKPIEDALSKNFDIILEIEVDGAMQVKSKFPQAITIFLVPPTFEELERRLVGRGTEDKETIGKRLSIAYDEIALIGKYDYCVLNETDRQLEAAEIIDSIVKASKYKVSEESARAFNKSFHKLI